VGSTLEALSTGGTTTILEVGRLTGLKGVRYVKILWRLNFWGAHRRIYSTWIRNLRYWSELNCVEYYGAFWICSESIKC
jgi:hypothetical protein